MMPDKGNPQSKDWKEEHLWWNNAINYIQGNLAVNGDFTLWLRDKFNDQATANAFIDSFNEFIKGDQNEKET